MKAPNALAARLSHRGGQLPSALRHNAEHRPRALAASALGLAAVTAGGAFRLQTGRTVPQWRPRKRCLHPMVVNAISGAMGEIVQTAALYPLDTIKVRCQARGLKTAVVLQELRSATCRRSAFASLYAGVGAAAGASALIGSCYLVSFYAAKKLAARGVTAYESRRAQQLAPGSGGRHSTAAAGGGQRRFELALPGDRSPTRPMPPFASVTDSVLAAQRAQHAQHAQLDGKPGRGQRRTQRRAAQSGRSPLDRRWEPQGHNPSQNQSVKGSVTTSRQNSSGRNSSDSISSGSSISGGDGGGSSCGAQSSHRITGRAAGLGRGSGSSSNGVKFAFSSQAAKMPSSPAHADSSSAASPATAEASRAHAEDRLKDNPWIDTAAALLASVSTSVLEGPVEVFRHRLQAGVSEGKVLGNIAAAFLGGGLRSVYHGYLPFVIKGIPYDVAELFTYSQLSAARERRQASAAAAAAKAAEAEGVLLPARGWQLPDTAADLLMGGAAGAAAVLASMPADCIKTVLELDPSPGPGGPLAGTWHFLKTGWAMVAERGPGALYTGMAPRLAQTVPSTMFYWLAVEACRRTLEPYTIQAEGGAATEAA